MAILFDQFFLIYISHTYYNSRILFIDHGFKLQCTVNKSGTQSLITKLNYSLAEQVLELYLNYGMFVKNSSA